MIDKKLKTDSEKLMQYFFESYTDTAEVKKKKEWQYNEIKKCLKEELDKRKLHLQDVIDVYPHCIKVEKETYEFPIYREAFDAVVRKLKEKGIEISIYTF